MEGLTADGKARITLVVACGASLCAGAVGGYLAARAQGKRDFADRVDAEVSREVEEVKRYYRDRLAFQTAEAERRGVAEAAAAMADPGPGDHEDERPAPVGRADRPWQGEPGHTAYHHPPVVPASPAGALPDENDNESPGRGDPLAGFPGTGTQIDDPSFWPAEEPDAGAPEPDVYPVADGGLTPFIITRTEYNDEDEETGNQKVGITYYTGDGVLADDKDVPIRDSAAIVGTDFLAGFGNADDPDIVYVRNNRVRIDFEIVRSEDGYAEHILNYGKPQ